MMRCISLWQPWASLWLVTPRAKLHETRHWHIKRQWPEWTPADRIVVHAAKKFVKDFDGDLASILREHFGPFWYRDMPTGALIGTVHVTACEKTETVFPPGKMATDMTPTERTDYECGDFYEGRYAWKGDHPIIFPEPIPYRGAQGIFSVPDNILPGQLAA